MGLLRTYIQKHFRNCICCQGLRIYAGGFCKDCFQALEQWKCLIDKTSLSQPRRIHSLFEWQPGKSDALSLLLLHLKGDREQDLWRFWAERFLLHHSHLIGRDVLGFAPVPARNPERAHALFFARAMSEIVDAPVVSLFIHGGDQHEQRQKDRNERLHRHVELIDGPDKNYILSGRSGTLILVDDVVTTGATVGACRHALRGSLQESGQLPVKMQVWCLARRGARY